MNKPSREWIELWMTKHSALVILSTALSILFRSHWWLFGMPLISFHFFYAQQRQQRGSWSFYTEPANLVSTFRLVSLMLLFAFHSSLSFRQIAIIATVILVLDGLDGYLARRFNTTSDFGAYLDMETDAYFVMVLSFLCAKEGLLPWAVIGLGLLRYIYFLLIRWRKPPERKERRSFIGQFIAVFLMGSLISCFVLPESIYNMAMLIATGLIGWSFGRDFLYMITHSNA
ncbi:MAG: CDP-alcohol phosphatidyltransferase family protein [Bacteroidota bacterium]